MELQVNSGSAVEIVQNRRFGGRFRIVGCAGSGEHGRVFLAEDFERNDEPVALKVISSKQLDHPELRARLRLMIRRFGEVESRFVLLPVELIEADGKIGLVFEYVESGSLADRLREQRVTLQETFQILMQVALGLEALHRVGVVHGNLKPENLLCLPNGQVLLADAGIAEVFRSRKSRESIAQEAAYHSPEFRRFGSADYRDDIFALGMLGRELLGNVHSVVESGKGAARLYPEQAPRELVRVLQKACDSDPDRRQRGATELFYEIEGAWRRSQISPLSPEANVFVGSVAVFSGALLYLLRMLFS